MSEMTLFQGGIPAHLKNAQLDEATKALMGAQTNKPQGEVSKRISIKAGVFRMIVDGKEIAKNEERAMPIIIAAAAPNDARTFYAKAFEEGQPVSAPDCWSDDGKVPNARAESPQASRCLDCPKSMKGSSGRGDTKACKYSRRIAVLLENDTKGELFQLTIPANSLWSSDNGKLGIKPYAEFLGGHGLNVTQVVTEMRFDTASSSPKLQFKALRPLTEEEIVLVQQQGKSPAALKAIGSTAAELDGAKLLAPAKAEATPAPKVETEPVVKEPVKREKSTAAPKDVNAILDDWAK
jgi:hypothetical protein